MDSLPQFGKAIISRYQILQVIQDLFELPKKIKIVIINQKKYSGNHKDFRLVLEKQQLLKKEKSFLVDTHDRIKTEN